MIDKNFLTQAHVTIFSRFDISIDNMLKVIGAKLDIISNSSAYKLILNRRIMKQYLIKEDD